MIIITINRFVIIVIISIIILIRLNGKKLVTLGLTTNRDCRPSVKTPMEWEGFIMPVQAKTKKLKKIPPS